MGTNGASSFRVSGATFDKCFCGRVSITSIFTGTLGVTTPVVGLESDIGVFGSCNLRSAALGVLGAERGSAPEVLERRVVSALGVFESRASDFDVFKAGRPDPSVGSLTLIRGRSGGSILCCSATAFTVLS